jgi:hypothetical protein
MEKYRKAFQLLWRLKRVEWSLNTGILIRLDGCYYVTVLRVCLVIILT